MKASGPLGMVTKEDVLAAIKEGPISNGKDKVLQLPSVTYNPPPKLLCTAICNPLEFVVVCITGDLKNTVFPSNRRRQAEFPKIC